MKNVINTFLEGLALALNLSGVPLSEDQAEDSTVLTEGEIRSKALSRTGRFFEEALRACDPQHLEEDEDVNEPVMETV